MRIALVWKNDYPWDIRIAKISKALSSMGHEVHVISRNLQKKNTLENLNGIFIHRLNPISNNFLNNIISTPAFINPFWILSMYRLCKACKIEAIIIRDLPLVLNGIIVAKALRIPTIFDMAENYPALWTEVLQYKKNRFYSFFIKNPALAKYVERFCVNLVDRILVVVEEAKLHLIRIGADESKISVVSNTPDIAEMSILMNKTNPKKWEEKLVLLYQGYVNKARGLGTVLKSIPKLLQEFNNLLVIIVGDGNDILDLKKMCEEMKIGNHVKFTGWIHFDEIPSMIKASDICIIPHRTSEHKNTTIPNKLFDYMACGKPVVVSNAKPLKRIVEEEQCGLVFESGDPESFTKAIKFMIHNPTIARDMGQRGRKAVERKYNWDNDTLVLKNAIDHIGQLKKV